MWDNPVLQVIRFQYFCIHFYHLCMHYLTKLFYVDPFINYLYFLNLLRDLVLSWKQHSSVIVNSWKFKEKTCLNLIFNSLTGISPLVSNPVGQFVVKDLVQYKDHAPVAMLQSTMTRIHNHKINKELLKGALIAFPNDRAASIRSGEDHENFR